MRKGFSATTFILVAVLVGALLMVGRTVIPPPPGPPEPPPTPKAPSGDPMVAKKNMPEAAMRAKYMAQMKQSHQTASRPGVPGKIKRRSFDPTQIEISAQWTTQRKQGEEGNREMADKVAEAKHEMALEKEKKAAATGAPSGMKASQ